MKNKLQRLSKKISSVGLSLHYLGGGIICMKTKGSRGLSLRGVTKKLLEIKINLLPFIYKVRKVLDVGLSLHLCFLFSMFLCVIIFVKNF
jgi:hypothetical protein